METITIENLLENFDEVFDRVTDGESFIISEDGVDKAVLMPCADYEEMIQKEE